MGSYIGFAYCLITDYPYEAEEELSEAIKQICSDAGNVDGKFSLRPTSDEDVGECGTNRGLMLVYRSIYSDGEHLGPHLIDEISPTHRARRVIESVLPAIRKTLNDYGYTVVKEGYGIGRLWW